MRCLRLPTLGVLSCCQLAKHGLEPTRPFLPAASAMLRRFHLVTAPAHWSSAAPPNRSTVALPILAHQKDG